MRRQTVAVAQSRGGFHSHAASLAADLQLRIAMLAADWSAKYVPKALSYI